MLKGGIVYADAITTVSNTYAEEIKTAVLRRGTGRPDAGEQQQLCAGS